MIGGFMKFNKIYILLALVTVILSFILFRTINESDHKQEPLYKTIGHLDSLIVIDGRSGVRKDIPKNNETKALYDQLKNLKFVDGEVPEPTDGFLWLIKINHGQIYINGPEKVSIDGSPYRIKNLHVYEDITNILEDYF